ncbi:MAG: hypothetical protein AB7Q42_22740 [Acidimicrobiia bacterium]
MVAVLVHDGDLEALAEMFVDALRSQHSADRNANEAKLSHLKDMVRRLDEVGLHHADFVSADTIGPADGSNTGLATSTVVVPISPFPGYVCPGEPPVW